MKVISSSEMARIERLAYQEGSSEREFMQEAGHAVAHLVQDFIDLHQRTQDVIVLCGKGNNGGDGYVAAAYLQKMGCHVTAFQLAPMEESSALCQENYRIFVDEGGAVQLYTSPEDLTIPQSGVILDALFGTGFHGKIVEPYASLIRLVNESKIPVIAIDIPSGLNGKSGLVEGEAIKAAMTIFLELPKTGFFLQNAWNYVGQLQHAEFGLPQKYLEKAQADFLLTTFDKAKSLLPPIERCRHKYEAGLVVGLAGSPGMPGAALLSSSAVLRSGAGMMRLLHPDGMQAELANSPFEIIKIPFQYENLKEIFENFKKAKAIFIGPGIGRTDPMRQLLKEVLPNIQKPCVVDGDALTLAAEDGLTFPLNAILTPHKGELMHLLKMKSAPALDREFLAICQEFTEKHQITLVMKGAPTFIFHPGEPYWVNPTGDPGMATAGSGDVLTGILAALLAQGLTTHQAAILGVYVHGLSGEYAARDKTSYSMIASDLIEYLSTTFSQLL